MADMTLEQMEKKLEEAGEKLGMALKNAPAEEKERLSSLYAKIKELAAKQAAENNHAIDVSALFAAGIVGDENIKDESLIQAAVDYIDQDLAYCKFRSSKLDEIEKKLEEASEKLGMALTNAPAEEKERLSSLYAKIKELAAQQAAENNHAVDASALFAAGIVGDENIKDESLIKAAVDYIDQDLAYCKFRSGK